ncbi:MAG: hypothetical protein ACW98U_09165 [Candidatus Thorarchaeota archaeon]|jgi:hypothetical protein
MSATQTRRESIQKEDSIDQVISLLEPLIPEEKMSQLAPWLSEIEMKARELIQPLTPSDTKALHPQAVAAAALYDAVLHYESRIGFMIVFSRFKDATGLSVHRIQKVWKRFFDSRLFLDIRRLTTIDVSDDDTPSMLVPNIITQIREALIEGSQTSDEWLSHIEEEALEILGDPSFVSEEFPEVTAVAAIYERARRHHGKKLIQLPHRVLGRICGWGEAKVARATKELFEKK